MALVGIVDLISDSEQLPQSFGGFATGVRGTSLVAGAVDLVQPEKQLVLDFGRLQTGIREKSIEIGKCLLFKLRQPG